MKTLCQKKLIESIELMEKRWTEIHRAFTKLKNGEHLWVIYRYVDVIGRGSFGVVVKIIDDKNHIFVLKCVYQDKRYYNRELDMLLKVNHQNIVDLAYYFYTDGTSSGAYLNIVMGFAGISLEEYISSGKGKSVEKIRLVYRQILEGLKYLHGKKICHRDIKPSNILINTRGVVKICDFGSAKEILDGGQNITYVCSRFYRAPEILLNHKEYDFKIDIWSTGCVIAEFMLQEPIFKGDTSASTLDKILKIVGATEEDLTKLGCNTLNIGSSPIGVRNYLGEYFEDLDLLDVLEKALIFSSKKRCTALELLSEKFFC